MAAFGPLVILALAALATARSPGATFDQRQEGKVNVQIDVKDLQIVALLDSSALEDYMSYDYAYDYADFTIKPSSRPTTARPSSITPTTSTTEASPTTTARATEAPTEPTELSELPEQPTTLAATSTATTTRQLSASTVSPGPALASPEPRKRCPAGFLLKSGRCFKRRLSLISPRFAVMKLAPSLLSTS